MNSLNFKNILVPVDFSETSMCAVEHASFLARRTKGKITFIHVLEKHQTPSLKFAFTMYNFPEYEEKIEKLEQRQAEFEERQETLVRNELSKLEQRMIDRGIPNVTSLIKKGDVHKKICSAAKKLDTDVIVMGTHGASGFREFMVGSNTYKVVRDAVCPVISVRKESGNPGFRNIFLPFVDKPHMREHVDYAISLAKIYDATLHILGIDTEKEESHLKKIKLEAAQIKKIAEKRGIHCTSEVFPVSYANDVIVNHAKDKKADLIVLMADLDKMNVMQYFTGPVVQQIVNHSAIPVLSIPLTYNPDAMYPEMLENRLFNPPL